MTQTLEDSLTIICIELPSEYKWLQRQSTVHDIDYAILQLRCSATFVLFNDSRNNQRLYRYLRTLEGEVTLDYNVIMGKVEKSEIRIKGDESFVKRICDCLDSVKQQADFDYSKN